VRSFDAKAMRRKVRVIRFDKISFGKVTLGYVKLGELSFSYKVG